MLGSNQKTFLLVLAENAPTIAFLATLQATGELRIAGWVGVIASAATLGAFYHFGRTFHPILLAINIYTLLATPVIEATYLLGLERQGAFMVAHVQVGVLASVFVVGSFLAIFSEKGFVGVKCEPPSRTLRPSLLLLVASAAAVAWSATYQGNRVMTIVLPLAVLFGLREFLIAGLKDRDQDTND